jgi:hypothetical protein
MQVDTFSASNAFAHMALEISEEKVVRHIWASNHGEEHICED